MSYSRTKTQFAIPPPCTWHNCARHLMMRFKPTPESSSAASTQAHVCSVQMWQVATDSVPTDVNERQGMRAGRGSTGRTTIRHIFLSFFEDRLNDMSIRFGQMQLLNNY
ncbi:hypothetical protein F442_03382 [Phytophthora nicotianae P10297]|uniref:Uncharacterized protein n=1 Tax=Phytophthora nicotianae P10297 TaxID=1317064 RepID=W2ZWZ7_PHYNI|nr:hypothetical protein F442_03382 [Phytophthora nicotianae P10297]